jgi:L-serine/L-threonine ammonia-lyase
MTILPVVPAPWIETPLVESSILSKLAGWSVRPHRVEGEMLLNERLIWVSRVLLKLENLQPSGSFKSRCVNLWLVADIFNRGIGNLIRKAVIASPANTPLHFYSSSGGNAGLACVTAATSLGCRSTVVVPTLTNQMMIDKIKTAGEGKADVIQKGSTWFEADKYLKTEVLANDPDGVYVPPFDHPDVWQGAATLVAEVENQMGGLPDAIVASVGGGGLMIGLCQGLANSVTCLKSTAELKITQVVAVETLGADSLHASVAANKLVTLPRMTSIAISLGATTVAEEAFKWALEPHVHSLVVSDKEAVEACLRFADDERILVEPACGATLAALYQGRLKEVIKLTDESEVVIVVCGGSLVSLRMLEEYRKVFDISGTW